MDHIHYFLSAHPKMLVTLLIKYLKGIMARKLFEQFSEPREKLWKGKL